MSAMLKETFDGEAAAWWRSWSVVLSGKTTGRSVMERNEEEGRRIRISLGDINATVVRKKMLFCFCGSCLRSDGTQMSKKTIRVLFFWKKKCYG